MIVRIEKVDGGFLVETITQIGDTTLCVSIPPDVKKIFTDWGPTRAFLDMIYAGKPNVWAKDKKDE